MTFKIPKVGFGGREVVGSLDRLLSVSLPTPDIAQPENFVSLPLRNPENYIQIPQNGKFIATRQGYENLSWLEARDAVEKDGLRMPTPDIFMQHFINLRDAARGRRRLYDGLGNVIGQAQALEHWNYVSSTSRSPFGNKPFWIWLDALFKEDPKLGKYMETDHVAGTSKKISLIGNLDENCFADLPFDSQGFPTQKSTRQAYEQGSNIYFWKPVINKVARFSADSGRAGLGCDWDPALRFDRLGVLPCAEGTSAPKN